MYRSVHSMNKGLATKQRIIETATELIHQHGMNVVSIGDVLRESGTGKSQFYSHFKSRDELVRTVLAHNEKRICDALSAPLDSWESVREWVFMHLKFQEAYGFDRGCPFGTAAYALQPEQSPERRTLQKMLDNLRGRLVRFLESEQARGLYSKSADPDRLSSFAVASIQGALILGLIERSEVSARAALQECVDHLESFRI